MKRRAGRRIDRRLIPSPQEEAIALLTLPKAERLQLEDGARLLLVVEVLYLIFATGKGRCSPDASEKKRGKHLMTAHFPFVGGLVCVDERGAEAQAGRAYKHRMHTDHGHGSADQHHHNRQQQQQPATPT